MTLNDRLSELRGRWERLTDRERTLVAGMGVVLVVVIIFGIGVSIAQGLSDLEDDNRAIRQALKDIDSNRDAYLRARQKTAQLEARMGRGAVQLQGYLESAAKEAGVEIAETVERQPAPLGKKYVEKTVDLRLRKVPLEPLSRFLRKIETGPNLVAVTSLSVRSRDDKHEDLEVEMGVSTYEHAPEGAKASHKKGDKGDKADKAESGAKER